MKYSNNIITLKKIPQILRFLINSFPEVYRIPYYTHFFFVSSTVVNQYYEAEVVSEYVIRGNTAVLKCNIPSFVADFVRVEAWVGSDNKEYTYTTEFGW